MALTSALSLLSLAARFDLRVLPFMRFQAVSNADMIVYDDVEFPVRGLLTVLLKAGGVSNVDAILPPLAPRRVRPDETWRRRYDELYQRFLEVQNRQAPLWDGPTWSKSSGRES